MNTKVYDHKRKAVVFSLMIIMIIFTTASVGACIVCNNFKENYKETIDKLYDSQFEYIEKYITVLNEKSYRNIYPLADEIELAIRDYYGDLNVLKDQLSEKNYAEVSELIGSYIDNIYLNNIITEQNDIIVAINDGIICDYSYSDADYISNTNTFRTWEIFINKSGNRLLADQAVKSIINKTDGIIFYETNVYPQTESHKSINNMDLSSLKNIYINEGISALKNYEFMVPVYITEDGDIFGQKDIIQGMRYENYKFIIIQTFNLYEQIEKNYNDILIEENNIRELEAEYYKNMLYMYSICFLICIGTIYYVFQISFLFNKYLNIEKMKSDIFNKK